MHVYHHSSPVLKWENLWTLWIVHGGNEILSQIGQKAQNDTRGGPLTSTHAHACVHAST